MANGICSIPNCGTSGRLARTWCMMHYSRWQRTGSLEDPRLTPIQRWTSQVDKNGPIPTFPSGLGPCWIWTGEITELGYGRFNVGELERTGPSRRRERALAHRWGYEQLIGPISEGLEPDHLCRNRACVNPGHLEPVTHRENMLRGNTVGAENAIKTHCKRGHEFTPANTYIQPSRPNARSCVACNKIRQARRVRRTK